MKYLILLSLIILPVCIFGQVTVSGKVADKNGKPVSGASVHIKDSYDGSTTDSAGLFRFVTSEKGNTLLEVSRIGFEPVTYPVSLGNSLILVNITMKELITELNAVVITAGSFEASDKKKGAVLTPIDIVTTAGANADITAALKTLPGTQQVGETEGLFVRGGTATESKIFIDGSLVNNFYYSSLPGIATRGRFNPFLFKGTVFSAGGYSALYGEALSAALVLESKDLPEKTSADLSVSVIGGSAGIQKLAKNRRASWGLTYSYTNLALAFAVIPQKQDFFKTPLYHQADGNFRFRTKNGGFIKYYGYLSWNHVGFRTADKDSLALQDAFRLENLNTFQQLSWRESFGKGWKGTISMAFSTNKDDIANSLENEAGQQQVFNSPAGYAGKNFSLANRGYYTHEKLVIEKKLQGLNTIRFGGEHFIQHDKTKYTLHNGQQFTETIDHPLAAVFAETDTYLSKDVAAKIGLRTEHSSLLNAWNIAPRASLAWKLASAGQISFAYGIFYQEPDRKNLPSLTPDPGFSKAAHYILQYQKMSAQRSLRTEIFYKDYTSLYKTGISPTGRDLVINNSGKGYAKGAEFFFRDKQTFKGVDYWISYSYLDTKRSFLNFPISMTPNFAAKHTASFVVKKFSLPLKTGFNASYTFASGRPYYHLQYDTTKSNYKIADMGKTISYNTLGFSLNYLPNLGKSSKKAFTVLVLSVTNVLGQKQVYGYDYAAISGRKTAIEPPARRFVYIGLFTSFGIDRTEDAINNNL